MVRFFNPFNILVSCVVEMFPDIDCYIQFTDQLTDPPFGQTIFEDNGDKIIEISVNVPMCFAVEILAHEFAHVIVGPDKEEHGKEWEDIFSKIHMAYNDKISQRG